MNIEEIKKYLDENKDKDDVKAFFAEIKKTSPEQEKSIVEKWLESNEGIVHVNPRRGGTGFFIFPG